MAEQQKTQGLTELTPDALQALMTAAMKAAREPSAEDAKKASDEKTRLAQRRANMIRMVETEQRAKANQQSNCSHRREDGKLAIGGQDMSNGHEVKICLRCQKVIVDRPTEAMSQAQAELQRLAAAGRIKMVNGKVEILETA